MFGKVECIYSMIFDFMATRKYLLRGYPRCAKAQNCLGITGEVMKQALKCGFTIECKMPLLGYIEVFGFARFPNFISPTCLNLQNVRTHGIKSDP